MELIYAEIFPSDSIDTCSYPAFIRDNNIQGASLSKIRGFPTSKINAELSEKPNLHHITSIKRNKMRISDNDMLTFDGMLEDIDAIVIHKKKLIKGEPIFCAFKDARKADKEDTTYLAIANGKNTKTEEILHNIYTDISLLANSISA